MQLPAKKRGFQQATAAMLVYLNKEMAAMMVYQTNPTGN